MSRQNEYNYSLDYLTNKLNVEEARAGGLLTAFFILSDGEIIIDTREYFEKDYLKSYEEFFAGINDFNEKISFVIDNFVDWFEFDADTKSLLKIFFEFLHRKIKNEDL